MTNVAELLEEHRPPIAKLARAVRRVVLEAIPDAEERVYTGWHGLGYHHPEAGYVCGLFPQAGRVSLGFENGVHLPDPDGLFTRGGLQVRYIDLEPGDEIPAAGIVELIDSAVARRSAQ